MGSLKNKIILITGGSKGIGYGVAEALLKEGARVAITSRSQKAADEAAGSLVAAGEGEAMGIQSDVRDSKSQQKAVEAVIKKWGTLDVLIANAGLGHFSNIESLTDEQWNETIDTNLTGGFYSIKACIPEL